MGFIKGYYIPTYQEIVDNCFAYARKEAEKVQEKNKEQKIRQKERKRIKSATEKAKTYLTKIVKSFPSLDKLDPFYVAMFENAVEVVELKKALSHISKSQNLLQSLMETYLVKINKRPVDLARKTRVEYYGRFESVIKKLRKSLEIVKNAFRVASELPKLKKLPTLLLIGLPNAGKSTFLKTITGANVKIKSYPFTTKKIQIGYLSHKYLEFQLVDSPGLLDRQEKKQNNIEKKTVITLKTIADEIVFVIDPTQSFSAQKNLIKRYKDKNNFIVITKIEEVEKDQIEELEKNLKDYVVFKIDQAYPDKYAKIIDQIKERIYSDNKDFYRRK